MTNFISISLFFFPIVFLSTGFILVYERFLYPLWLRATYIKTFPKVMYQIATASALISWVVPQLLSETSTELAKSSASFISGAAISVFAAVVFYYFTNHVPEIKNKVAAYRTFESQLRGLVYNQTSLELQFLGSIYSDLEATQTNIGIHSSIKHPLDGLAEPYVQYLSCHTTLGNDLAVLQRQRAALTRMDRYVTSFDQDVRNSFDLVEKYTDELLLCFADLEEHQKHLANPAFIESAMMCNNAAIFRTYLFASIHKQKVKAQLEVADFTVKNLLYFIMVLRRTSNLCTARIELNEAIEKHVKPAIV